MKMVTADGKITPYPIEVGQARVLFKDRDGDLWIGTGGQGILHLHGERTDRFIISDGLSSNNVLHIFQDREGNVWVATSRGLDKFTKPAVPSITSKQGLSIDYVNSVLTDREGVIWLGTLGGLHKVDNGRVIKSTIKLPNDFVTSLFETSKGRMLVATNTEKGVVWLDRDRAFRLSKASPDNVFGVAEDNRGDLWVATREPGLQHLSGDGRLMETFPKSMLGKLNIAVAFDPKRDGLWLTSSRGELGFFRDGKLAERYGPKDGLGEGIVHDPQVDSDGGVWVSTRVGLAHLKDGKIAVLGRKNGLPCDAVHWMRHGRDHNVWLYTECGLVAFSENDLSSWIADPSDTVAIIHYFDNTDGVENVAYNGWYTPQAATTTDGRILFATTTGVSILDPGELNQNTLPPPVHIEEITADERGVGGSGRISFPARVRRLHIAFTALSFTAPRKVRFRYKLQGYDKDWSEPVSFRDITYTNLPPGDYQFRLIASNDAGVWNTTGDTLSFYIPPMFYQTIWFRFLLAMGAACLLWVLYALRLRKATAEITARLGERLQERERIARELHDTLLQSFHGLMFRFQAARNMLPRSPESAMRTLDEAISSTRDAITESRDAIHDLRSEPPADRDLVQLLEAEAEELRAVLGADQNSPSFRVIVEGEPQKIPEALHDGVYRIAREAMRNAFRHARANKVEAEIRYDKNQLRLRVRDDGKGLDSKVLEVSRRPGHWGLEGIRERAQQIGAQLKIWSQEGAGTEIELTVPDIAYKDARNNSRFKLFRKDRVS
jgi:signal transduction histidine kinase/streptogramin lyase